VSFAPAIEFLLLFMLIAFALIELIALIIGVGLTRTITRSVASLYQATQRVNRGDLSHRIAVKSKDQLAALETSFNSMTESLEKLLAEQKEKQRLENELVIAQEVQAQLFPREISQLESLEVHGFCRPARTVSGDYYDFLRLNSHKLTLAVGDISGKGISAALLMATIHSAVRAYTLETVPSANVPMALQAGAGSGLMVASTCRAWTCPPVECCRCLIISYTKVRRPRSTPPSSLVFTMGSREPSAIATAGICLQSSSDGTAPFAAGSGRYGGRAFRQSDL
jgi:HAMP domain-containing protein